MLNGDFNRLTNDKIQELHADNMEYTRRLKLLNDVEEIGELVNKIHINAMLILYLRNLKSCLE